MNVLEKLIDLGPTQVQQMIEANDFSAFIGAALNGHLAVLNRLVSLAPTKVQQMIEADRFYAFRVAAINGHFEVLDRLVVLASCYIPTNFRVIIENRKVV